MTAEEFNKLPMGEKMKYTHDPATNTYHSINDEPDTVGKQIKENIRSGIRNSVFNNANTNAITSLNNNPIDKEKADEFQIGEQQAEQQTADDKWLRNHLGFDYDWRSRGYGPRENKGMGFGQIASRDGKNVTGDEMIVELMGSGDLDDEQMKTAVQTYLGKGNKFKRLETLLENGVDVDKFAPDIAKGIFDRNNDGSMMASYEQWKQTKLGAKQSGTKPIPLTTSNENNENFIENSNEAVANAKPGDKLRRNDGTIVTLTQEDIDDARNSANANGNGNGNGNGNNDDTPEQQELENIGEARTETIGEMQDYRDDDNFSQKWDDWKKQYGEELDEIDPATKRQVYQSAWSMYKGGVFGEPGSKEAKRNMGMAIVGELGKFMSGLGANLGKLGGHDFDFGQNNETQIDTIRKKGVENAMEERNKFNLARMEQELKNAGYEGERLQQIQSEIDKFATNPEYSKYFNRMSNAKKRMTADISMQIADIFGDSTESQRLGLMLSNQLNASQYNAVAVREALDDIKNKLKGDNDVSWKELIMTTLPAVLLAGANK